MSYSGRDLIKYVQENIIYQAGVDYESKPMLVFNACHLPDPKSTDYDGLLSVILSTLDDFVENDYVVVLFSSGSQYRPGVLWLLKAYRRLTRKYKKNLKNLYIVHPAKWVKLIFDTMNKILSPKFFKKLAYVETLTDLSKLVPVHQINIPQAVIDYNRAGDPTFHRSGVLSSVPKKVAATSGQYGVPLDQLMGPKGEKGIPSAIRICVEFLEKEGIEVEGIFRRSPSSAELKVVKADLNNGQ
ncbi:divergent CRAL/TRIO domain-containing protein [Paraphysoderma sedebokerense]|nr:divergent CRAL/TRIO domain-containing protein [Paraphysoderma sedebokerense]